jgi:hypothetical protein
MASLHGYHQLFDLNYTYNKTDLRSTANPKDLMAAPNTIYGTLQRKDRFKLFSFILRNSLFNKQLSSCSGQFTIFAVPDEYILKNFGEAFVLNMDHFDALKIIRHHTIPNVITMKEILTEEGSSLTNMNNHGNMYAYYDEPTEKTFIDGGLVLEEINCVNGNIIVIDKITTPYWAY